MSIFEERGVQRQHEAHTLKQAIKSFKRSCERCCYTGKYIHCDSCAIANAHNDILKGVIVLR